MTAHLAIDSALVAICVGLCRLIWISETAENLDGGEPGSGP